MFTRSTNDDDAEGDNRKPAARPSSIDRKSPFVAETKDNSSDYGQSPDDRKSSYDRKRRAENDEGESGGEPNASKEPTVDLATVAGQLAVNPGMSEEDAREAAKKEYHRKHAAKSRVRHKGLLRDLNEKVGELRRTNRELRETHEQLVSQLRAYEHVEPGISSRAGSLPNEGLSGSDLGSSLAGTPQAVPTVLGSVNNATLSELLQDGMQIPAAQRYLQPQSQMPSLESLIQARSLASQAPLCEQPDTLGLIQQLSRQGRDGSNISALSVPSVEAGTFSRLLSGMIHGQSMIQQQHHVHPHAAALPMSAGSMNAQLNHMLQYNDTQRALLGLYQGNQSPTMRTASLSAFNPSASQDPTAEARQQQELIEFLLRYLSSGGR
jgi:hypothetical protein